MARGFIRVTQRPEFFVFRDDRENFDKKVTVEIDRIAEVTEEVLDESRIILKDGTYIPVRQSAGTVRGMMERFRCK
jgi:hypothetical protein